MQLLPLNDIHHCAACCNCQGIASISTEEFDVPFPEAISYFLSADDSSHREAIPHSLSNGEDVWNHSIIFKSPVVLAQTAKAGLDLISNANYSFFLKNFVEFLVEILGRDDLPSAALHELADESRGVCVDDLLEVVHIILDGVERLSELASVKAGNFCEADMVWFLIILIPFVGTNFHAFTGNSMICAFEANHFLFVCVNRSHLHCEVVGFRSRVHESNYSELFGENIEQFVSTCHQLIIQEPGISQKSLVLRVHLHHKIRMTVPDMRNIIDAV